MEDMLSAQERQDIRDLLAIAERIGGSDMRLAVWRQIPHHIRMRFNYGKTSIVPKGEEDEGTNTPGK